MRTTNQIPNGLRWALYRRRSTDEHQAESLEVQLENARRFVEAHGGTLDAKNVFTDDAISRAEFKKRPGLLALLNAARRGDFDAVVTRDETRLGGDTFRTGLVVQDLLAAEVRLHYYATSEQVTLDSSTDKIMLAVRNFASELEREKTAQRTREHLELRARRGLQVGGRVYGYDNHEIRHDGRRSHVEYRVNEKQAEVIREIFRRYAAGEGLRTIAKDLNARGVPSPTVGRRGRGYWQLGGIQPMLRRERYLGRLVWGRKGKQYRGGTRVRIDHAESDHVVTERPDLRIVDDDLWTAVQARIEKQKVLHTPKSRGRGRPARYLLSGLARCGCCGGAMLVAGGRDGKKPIKVYTCSWYKNRGLAGCQNSLRKPVEEVDALVLDWIRERVLTEEIVVQVLREVRRRLDERMRVADTETPAIEEQVGKLRGEIANLTAAIATGGAGALPSLVAAIKQREETVTVLEGRLRGLRAAPDVIGMETRRMEKEAQNRLQDLRALTHRNPEEARRALEALLDEPLKFTPTPDKHYVIEAPVFLGALFPNSSDPSGSFFKVHLADRGDVRGGARSIGCVRRVPWMRRTHTSGQSVAWSACNQADQRRRTIRQRDVRSDASSTRVDGHPAAFNRPDDDGLAARALL